MSSTLEAAAIKYAGSPNEKSRNDLRTEAIRFYRAEIMKTARPIRFRRMAQDRSGSLQDTAMYAAETYWRHGWDSSWLDLEQAAKEFVRAAE